MYIFHLSFFARDYIETKMDKTIALCEYLHFINEKSVLYGKKNINLNCTTCRSAIYHGNIPRTTAHCYDLILDHLHRFHAHCPTFGIFREYFTIGNSTLYPFTEIEEFAKRRDALGEEKKSDSNNYANDHLDIMKKLAQQIAYLGDMVKTLTIYIDKANNKEPDGGL